ncbi:unnamed protein product, partial [Brassica oleracea]
MNLFFSRRTVNLLLNSTTEVHLLRVWEAEPLKQAPAPAEECKERRRAYMLLLDVEVISANKKSITLFLSIYDFYNSSYSYASHHQSPPFDYLRTFFQGLFDLRRKREPVSSIPQELFQFSDYEQLQHIFL